MTNKHRSPGQPATGPTGRIGRHTGRPERTSRLKAALLAQTVAVQYTGLMAQDKKAS